MENESTVKLISLDTIPVQEVEWLVYPFIPCGKITIIQGDPGEGKTTFILQQRDLPDGGGWSVGYH